MPLVRFVFVWFSQFGVSDQILTALRWDCEIYRNFGDIDNQFPWGSPRTRNKRIRLSRGRPHSSENAWHAVIDLGVPLERNPRLGGTGTAGRGGWSPVNSNIVPRHIQMCLCTKRIGFRTIRFVTKHNWEGEHIISFQRICACRCEPSRRNRETHYSRTLK